MTTAIAPADLVGLHLDALALSLGLPKPAREVYGITARRYRWDFAFVEQMVAVEYQGGTWTTGGHSTGTGIDRDAEKLILGQLDGWLVIPVTATMVRSGRAIELVERALRLRMQAVK